ncbi:hypothetical protein NX059_002603 [Plenodomus lindquistii]|nr:hypothetical protein NX059_002603 [Plenodomus lindquistii]
MSAETPSPLPHLSTSQTALPTTSTGDHDEESLTPLEQEVLDEYARLLGNLNTMSTLLLSLSNAPSAAILDGLRGLERKTSLVFTLLKASVYSIVLNQQISDASGANDTGSHAGGLDDDQR